MMGRRYWIIPNPDNAVLDAPVILVEPFETRI
jgi:hypothetical protein